jgi:hypothetical protein
MASKGEIRESMMSSPKRDQRSIEIDQARLDEIMQEIKTKHVTPTLKILKLGKIVTVLDSTTTPMKKYSSLAENSSSSRM